MVKLNPEICYRIKEARRKAGLSQGEVSAEVGCKQPALSMFEQGDGTKLNDEVIEKLAKKFGVDLHAVAEDPAEKATVVRVESKGPVIGFCPNPHCPSNISYEVEGRLLLKPNRALADPVGGKFCALCGEVLEKKCPTCGSPVHEGGFCSFCGDPYVAVAR